MNDQDRIKSFLNNLASAVIGTIKSGSADDRKRLIGTLRDMDAQMPGMSEDTAGAKEFLQALVSLLDGTPISPEGLAEPYAGIYAVIITETLADGRPKKPGGRPGGKPPEKPGDKPGGDNEMKEFLTQVAATVVLVMQTGSDEDKNNFALKLREVHKAIPQDKNDARTLILALVSILEDSPFDAEALPKGYSHFYRKVIESIKSDSR